MALYSTYLHYTNIVFILSSVALGNPWEYRPLPDSATQAPGADVTQRPLSTTSSMERPSVFTRPNITTTPGTRSTVHPITVAELKVDGTSEPTSTLSPATIPTSSTEPPCVTYPACATEPLNAQSITPVVVTYSPGVEQNGPTPSKVSLLRPKRSLQYDSAHIWNAVPRIHMLWIRGVQTPPYTIKTKGYRCWCTKPHLCGSAPSVRNRTQVHRFTFVNCSAVSNPSYVPGVDAWPPTSASTHSLESTVSAAAPAVDESGKGLHGAVSKVSLLCPNRTLYYDTAESANRLNDVDHIPMVWIRAARNSPYTIKTTGYKCVRIKAHSCGSTPRAGNGSEVYKFTFINCTAVSNPRTRTGLRTARLCSVIAIFGAVSLLLSVLLCGCSAAMDRH